MIILDQVFSSTSKSISLNALLKQKGVLKTKLLQPGFD
jgi:hypothetical protein